MIKKLFFVFILLPLFVFSQDTQALRERAEAYYQKGDFLQSYQTLNKIKDKKTLENTNVNLYKSHLENIMQHHFFKKVRLNDSLYKVYIKSNVLKSQGIYNEKSKKYTLPPVYDSIPYREHYFKYLPVYKNKQEAFVNIETGKVIIPLGNKSSIFYGDYILSGTMNKYNDFSFDDLVSVFDLNGNLLFKDLDTFNTMYYPNFIRTKKKNKKYQIFDIRTKKIILDDFDYTLDPTGSIIENDISYDNVWLPFHKNDQNYLYKLTSNEIIDTHKFDTYIPLYSNFRNFGNAITILINLKDNAPFALDTVRRIYYGSEYTIVKKDNKFGIFNISKDKYYKEPVYDSINKFGNTFYNGKWINLIYDEEICEPDNDKPEGIIFKRNNLFGLMDLSGKIIAEADYNDIRFLWNGVFTLRKGQKWGFIGVQKEDKLVSPQFDYIEYLSGDFGNVACYKNKKAIKYFRNGSKIDLITLENQKYKKYKSSDEPNPYSNINDLEKIDEFDRVVFEKKGKYGLDDFYNKEVVEGKYSNLRYGIKNTFIASLGSFVGLIDHNGKEIIPVKYANMERGGYNSDLFFVAFDNGLQSIFNSKGKMLYPPKIKEATIYDYNSKTRTSFVFVTELSQDETKIDNSEKKVKNYKGGVIKIKDDKAERLNLEGNSFSFANSNFMISKNENRGTVVFYNLKNDKVIDGEFNYYFIDDYKNHRIFAKRGYYYDTVIDSLGNVSTLEHPFDEVKNDNYFFKEGANTGVMNKELQAADFRYPVLKNLVEEYRFMSFYPSKEYCEKASSYFKFNPKNSTEKNGVIKFDGTIIFENGIYDDIQFLNFGKTNNDNSFVENEFLKQYKNDLFICTNNKKEYKTIQLVTSKKEIVAKFEMDIKGSWNFSSYNNSIIIKSADSAKVYDLKSKKIQFEKQTNRFEEDKDSGYTIAYMDQKTAKVKYEKYDYKGKLISNTIVDNKTAYNGKTNENYIVKRNDKYGTINSKGKEGIPFVYDSLESKNGIFFISKSDNLFGIIDADNQTLVDKKYEDISWIEIKERQSSYNVAFSGYKMKEKNKWGLLDSNLKTLLPTEFDTIKCQKSILTAKKDSLVSVYDFNGEELFTAAVDSIDLDSNNSYSLYKNGKKLFRAFNGEITEKNPYVSSEDQLKTMHTKQIGGKYYLSKNDSILHKTPVISIKEAEVDIDFVGERLEQLLIHDENNFYGLYTKDLKQILPFLFEEIVIVPNEDFYIVKKAGKYGVVNSQNQTIIPSKYDNVSFNRGIFYCTKNKITYHITPETK
ncbi:WG repeat-containing protein [Flavobacterium pectinovorum]|uniref:WG repeat-containing protein n=1 Tax=Flavobacterium pectinovorum TaxID=29533 RepID=A0A502F7H4_9FLAO|nr:WG repeat-containing protein [Flavobacterium pectinovorum]TPG45311.1 hypothetical protein EAH81_01545 [Flavobacterium pectinovorum]